MNCDATVEPPRLCEAKIGIMRLTQLRYFIAVAEELHFGKAALRLHVAQPALSRQIRHLEEELQVSLLLRTKRHVELTGAGRIFLREARSTLVQAERAARLAQSASRGENGELSVSYVPWADVTSIPSAIRRFGQRHSEFKLLLHRLTTPEQVAALRDGKIDVGFMRPIQTHDLMVKLLFSEPLIVAFRSGSELEAYRRVPWNVLSRLPYVSISHDRAPYFASVVARAAMQAGIALKAQCQADHPQTILALVEAGIGVSLVPASLAKVSRRGISHRFMRPTGPLLSMILAWRRGDRSRALHTFIRVVEEVVGPLRTLPPWLQQEGTDFCKSDQSDL